MKYRGYLGIDVGSISTNIVFIDEDATLSQAIYLRTFGAPINSIKLGFNELRSKFSSEPEILGVGASGSARNLVGSIIGADIIKNEITAHGLGAIYVRPDVQTVLEIGGQDSKIIIIRDGIIVDFGMNTVCAAGTGSFLDHQAFRLGVPIEEIGQLAVSAKKISPIAGRCAVFAESDMIHKQQMGYNRAEIIAGLCNALAMNFLNNVAKGKNIQPPILFQGGVAANQGIKASFERILNCPLHIPPYFNVMGAYGAALLARESVLETKKVTSFRGFDISTLNFETKGFFCRECPNTCEIIEVFMDKKSIALSGDRCGRYSAQSESNAYSSSLVQCQR
ncbi:acyl-CoA dehydratase activase [candidate division CSSED10-310 bacterium]|uniref:Acyl-CoA dehydratase activase n=1 Tax=candidate division CSSED10-310 bacterium TaxID=2855610 RepID=A0ABV6Z0M9_UNCC1